MKPEKNLKCYRKCSNNFAADCLLSWFVYRANKPHARACGLLTPVSASLPSFHFQLPPCSDPSLKLLGSQFSSITSGIPLIIFIPLRVLFQKTGSLILLLLLILPSSSWVISILTFSIMLLHCLLVFLIA